MATVQISTEVTNVIVKPDLDKCSVLALQQFVLILTNVQTSRTHAAQMELVQTPKARLFATVPMGIKVIELITRVTIVQILTNAIKLQIINVSTVPVKTPRDAGIACVTCLNANMS
ncbi:hypothetical protein DPMN_023807 [Dreissena polymorpha]|uniref:Uncharacterized protein n=1 Tax=Dreissena polymorpha TaxID=45954 RepID=A0A9D4LN70_DREPO|nr:hypothetical protein DPMN_023807 [Dreissena polymorpha]